MGAITDTATFPLGYLLLDVQAGDVNVIQVLLTPIAGDILQAVAATGLTIKTRVTGSGLGFVDITTGLSMTPYLGVTTGFDIQITAGSGLTGYQRIVTWLGLVRADAAGWNN